MYHDAIISESSIESTKGFGSTWIASQNSLRTKSQTKLAVFTVSLA